MTTSVIVIPLSAAFAFAGSQIESGTRTEWFGVAG